MKNYGKGYECYTKAEQERIAASRLMTEEGMVLLENNGVLPLAPNAKASVFGSAQIDFLTGGSGSGATSSGYVVTIPEAMRACGLRVNEDLARIYAEYCAEQDKAEEEERAHNVFMKKGTAPDMPLADELVENAARGFETAIVVLSRMAGEGQDRKLLPGDYYLSDLERDILQKTRKAFSRTIVVLNIAGVIDMEWVDEYKPDAVLITWLPGQEGANTVADILIGKVNPSGKLTDTIARNYMDHPSSHNFGGFIDGMEQYTGDEKQVKYWGMIGNHTEVPVGKTVERPIGNRWFTEYQEGIYVGYRYFETFGIPVRYPFGFGLSYAHFEIRPTGFEKNGDKITFSVTVTNTGGVPGKEVVQIYVQCPDRPIERPARELLVFIKTRLLAPGERQTLAFEVNERQLAVYSEERAAYVLQKGANRLYVGNNVRDCKEFAVFETEEKRAEQCENHFALTHTRPLRQLSKWSREDTFPTPPPIRSDGGEKMGEPKEPMMFQVPEPQPAQYKLRDVRDGTVGMETFLQQAVDIELVCLCVGTGMGMGGGKPVLGELTETVPHAGGHTATIQRLGIPSIVMSDGPAGIAAELKERSIAFATSQVTACSWNETLAEELGNAFGGEAKENHVDVWLAPAMNIHRNPLCGRNYEYYSEDPVVSGKMAAAIVRGAQRHNIAACLKHFAVNNQETNRFDGVDAVATERVIREIYLKGFEIAVKEGRPKCIMTSYNSINGTYASVRADLTIDVLRGEWGYDGFVVTDWEGDGPYAAEALKAHNDLLMPGFYGQIEYVLNKLKSGEIKRAELIACAAHILNFVMYSNSFERHCMTEEGVNN